MIGVEKTRIAYSEDGRAGRPRSGAADERVPSVEYDTDGRAGNAAHLSTPFTVDGLILAASMLILDASRRHHPVPLLARWCLGAGITATFGAKPGPRPGITARSGHWSAPGPPWPWLAPSNFS